MLEKRREEEEEKERAGGKCSWVCLLNHIRGRLTMSTHWDQSALTSIIM